MHDLIHGFHPHFVKFQNSGSLLPSYLRVNFFFVTDNIHLNQRGLQPDFSAKSLTMSRKRRATVSVSPNVKKIFFKAYSIHLKHSHHVKNLDPMLFLK